jgi:hypothetical protein
MKMAVSWNVASCSVVDIGGCFRVNLMIQVASSSETSVNIQTTRCNIRVIALMKEAVSISETEVNVYQTTRATTQMTTIFILATV